MSFLITPSLSEFHTIQWHPPGEFTINPECYRKDVTCFGPPKIDRYVCEESAVKRLNSYLCTLLERKCRAFFDANHDETSKIAFVHYFYWAGTAPNQGVRAQIEWTSSGLKWIREMNGEYFSPSFQVSEDGKINPSPWGFNSMGGFTNHPSIKTIRPVLERPDLIVRPEPRREMAGGAAI